MFASHLLLQFMTIKAHVWLFFDVYLCSWIVTFTRAIIFLNIHRVLHSAWKIYVCITEILRGQTILWGVNEQMDTRFPEEGCGWGEFWGNVYHEIGKYVPEEWRIFKCQARETNEYRLVLIWETCLGKVLANFLCNWLVCRYPSPLKHVTITGLHRCTA